MLTNAALAELAGAYQRTESVGALLEGAVAVLENVDLLQRDSYVGDRVSVQSCCALGALGLIGGTHPSPGLNEGITVVHGMKWASQRGNRMVHLSGKRLVRFTDATRLLTEVTGYQDLQAWNDAEGRTMDEVLDAFYDAIVLAHQRRL